MSDHFLNQLLEGEDLTFEEYQELKNSKVNEKRIEAERLQAAELSKTNADKAFFNELLTLDAEIEALAIERSQLDNLRVIATEKYDRRELDIRQEWYEKRLRFDELFRRFNKGQPFSQYGVEAMNLIEKLRQGGGKVENVALPILKTSLSVSAQVLWDKIHKPETKTQPFDGSKYVAAVLKHPQGV
jgi:hypothetical protein